MKAKKEKILDNKKLDDIVKTLQELKLEKITVYDLNHENPLFDYFVIATASNKRQLSAFLDKMYEKKLYYDHIEGKEDSQWILVDMKNIIVNIMTEEARSLYSLDSVYIHFNKTEYES